MGFYAFCDNFLSESSGCLFFFYYYPSLIFEESRF